MSMGGGGSGGAVANLFIRLRADTSAAVAGLRTAKGEMSQVGSQAVKTGQAMSATGKKMTMGLTVPLVAIGAKAIKSAVQFDDAFTKIEALVGVASDEVATMRDRTLELAGETARAPQELADAMFFITSAGLEGAAATDVLEQSAKAAAVGLGDTAVVADLATSAMNAYGEETLSAEAATDTLTAAVRLGKLEPDQLAGSMGRVIPVASAMGIEFHELGAAFAAMSRTGTNANEASTQLRGILTQLLKPTTDAQAALAGVGLSIEDVHTSLRDDGLLATLLDLKERFGDNVPALSAVFGNVRALSGVMDMLGSNVEGTVEIFSDMTDVAGETDAAFEKTSETARFKLDQAMANLQTAMIDLGSVLMPIAADLAAAFGDMAGKFADLPAGAQTAIAIFGGLVAAMGPVLWVAGTLVTKWGQLMGALEARGMHRAVGGMRKLGRAAGALGGIAVAAGAAFMLRDALRSLSRQLVDGKYGDIGADIDRLANSIQAAAEGRLAGVLSEDIDGLNNAVANINQEERLGVLESGIASLFGLQSESIDEMREQIEDLDTSLSDFAKENGLEATETALRTLVDAMDDVDSVDELLDKLPGLAGVMRDLENGVGGAAGAGYDWAEAQAAAAAAAQQDNGLEGLEGDFGDVAEGIEEAQEALDDWEDALRAQFDPLFNYQDALHGLDDAAWAVQDAQTALNGAIAEHGSGSREAQEAGNALEQALSGQAGAALDSEAAYERLNQAVEYQPELLEDAIAMLDRWVETTPMTREEADALEADLRGLGGTLEDVGGLRETATLDAEWEGVGRAIEEARAATHFSWASVWWESHLDADKKPADDSIFSANKAAGLWDTRTASALLVADNRPAWAAVDDVDRKATGWSHAWYTATVDADASRARAEISSLFPLLARLDIQVADLNAQGFQGLRGKPTQRRTGGPVFPGRIYEVNEDPGPGELLHSGGHQYLLAGQQGEVVPLSPLARMTAESASGLAALAVQAQAPPSPSFGSGSGGSVPRGGGPSGSDVKEWADELVKAMRREGVGEAVLDGRVVSKSVGRYQRDDVRARS